MLVDDGPIVHWLEPLCRYSLPTSGSWPHQTSDVKSSRPKWPRGQHFGLGLASISLSYYV